MGVAWRAITEPGHLEAWFPPRIIGEWTAGAPLTFEARGGEHPALDGEVLACDPPSLLEFRCGTDVIRFEIKPHAGDAPGCTFVLTDAFDELGKAASHSAGSHLPRLLRRDRAARLGERRAALGDELIELALDSVQGNSGVTGKYGRPSSRARGDTFPIMG